jgi:hypothetical protein
MDNILKLLHDFTFTIDFNQNDLNKFNLVKNIKVLLHRFMDIDLIIKKNNLDHNQFELIKTKIILKLTEKIQTELDDEKDLIKVYENKLLKYFNKIEDYNDINHNDIKKIIETPLEGEMAKHNKIKYIISKLVYKDNNLDILFYVKYKECDTYNKQILGLLKNISKKILI